MNDIVPESMTPDECRKLFYVDGSLRDLYVKADTSKWNEFYLWASSNFTTSYRRDGEPHPAPSSAAEVLEDRSASHILDIETEGVTICCHFFIAGEIELDIDPQEVHTTERCDAVLAFMQQLANLLGEDVVLTPENTEETVLARCTPAS